MEDEGGGLHFRSAGGEQNGGVCCVAAQSLLRPEVGNKRDMGCVGPGGQGHPSVLKNISE
jgi:hypothetical protein